MRSKSSSSTASIHKQSSTILSNDYRNNSLRNQQQRPGPQRERVQDRSTTSTGTGSSEQNNASSRSTGTSSNVLTLATATGGTGAGSRISTGAASSRMQMMMVDKQIVDELLLVCGVIGTTTKADAATDDTGRTGTTTGTTIVPVTDCVQWLQDLQRCLRRDDDVTRLISILLHSWNIVVSKLLPLIVNIQYDTTLLLTICKIIVLLTKPLHSQTVIAGKMMINTKSNKSSAGINSDISDAALRREQMLLRDNALQQASILMDYKRAFCHSGSTPSSSSLKGEKKMGGIFSVFVALLAEPLSRVGNARTDSDHLTIELIIYLFRNLLIAEPILNTSGTSSSKTNDIHFELLTIFEEELVLDILYVLCADIEQRENVSYNLLLMELIQLLFKHQNPTMIAAIGNHSSTNQQEPQHHPTSAVSSVTRPISRPHVASGAINVKQRSLLRSIQQERQSMQSCSTSRHSHFGGTIVLENKSNGHKQLIGASLFNAKQSSTTMSATSQRSSSSSQQQQLLLLSRRKNKNLEPFIGANHNQTTTGCNASANTTSDIFVSLWHKKSMKALHSFCTIFVFNSKCYGPLMKSLKNEFRRDSVRLEDNDRIVYFQVVTFFCTWYRTNLKLHQQELHDTSTHSPTSNTHPNDGCIESDRVGNEQSSSSIGQLIFTMDVFSFNLVLNATDTFQEHKKYVPLSHSVALLREMMHLLYMMMQNSSATDAIQNSDVDSAQSTFTAPNATEQIMAMGLMDRLFYSSEPLDRLPKLVSRWSPGTSTREYVCDLVEIIHLTLKVLEENSKLCRSATISGSTNLNQDDSTKHDTVAKMKDAATEFDIESYFVRKIVSNHTISMYTHLLSCYAINAPEINQYILSFFERVRHHVLSSASDDGVVDTMATTAGDDEGDLAIKNPFTSKAVTMEPMLYNAQLFVILNNILNDASIRSDLAFAGLTAFATSIVCNFAVTAQSNPVLFVEVLLKHPSPHRFCDMITNSYVSEDLRMLVERDILLQQQYQLEQEVEAFNNNNSQHDLDDMVPESTRTALQNSYKDGDDSSESSDEELEFTDEPLDNMLNIHAKNRLAGCQEKNHSESKYIAFNYSDNDDSDCEDDEVENEKENAMVGSKVAMATDQRIDYNEGAEENDEVGVDSNNNREVTTYDMFHSRPDIKEDCAPVSVKRNEPESTNHDDDLSKKQRKITLHESDDE